jgi:hypothetical protein
MAGQLRRTSRVFITKVRRWWRTRFSSLKRYRRHPRQPQERERRRSHPFPRGNSSIVSVCIGSLIAVNRRRLTLFAAFPVKIWVEVDKIDFPANAQSDNRFGDVRQAIADALGVGVIGLSNLIYQLDCSPKTTNYRRFTTQEDWDSLLTDAKVWRAKEALKKGGGSPNAWSVRIRLQTPSKNANPTNSKVQIHQTSSCTHILTLSL